MLEVTAVFWDIGGVLLTNGWDHLARRRAAEHFGLDAEELEARNAEVVAAFETRQLTLHEYIDQTVLDRPRPFSEEEFRKFMFAQSQPCRKALEVAEDLSRSRRYLMAALNNEALELNLYRIRQFELRKYLSVFFSSCFVEARKPGREIYCRALEFTQRPPGECIMIDDRPENLEAPRTLGMRVIQFRTPAQLREELAAAGIVSGLGAT
jgi:putative hydrolase of the HAD superfamily